jgi:two-component system, LuxR family, sensor kinase FixL
LNDALLFTMKTNTFRNKTKAELIGELEDLRRRLTESEKTEAERQHAVEALRVSEEKYRILLDESSDAIFAFYPDGEYRYVNRAFANGVGKNLEDIIGKKIWDVFPKEEADKRFAVVKWVFENGESKVIEVRVPRPDGDRYHITTVKPILDDQRRVISVICISKEITERKQAEEKLRLLNETLERIVAEEVAKGMAQERLMIQQSRLAAMGEMIGNIAHQWRQPLSALSILLQNIRLDYEEGLLNRDEVEDYTKTGAHLIQKMSGTIDDFRNFFKPNKEKQNFCACDGVAEAIKLVSESFKISNIDIAFDKPDDLGKVGGYPNEFAQVVLNALSNAKDVIVEKKKSGKVHIRAEKGRDTVTISIRDNGGGVPEDILPKVFDPYFTTKDKGTGIGLYMSKMIMEHMDGGIAIQNVDGGAEVLLTLPVADPAE